MDKFVVIMAGGSGTRLWPLSKETKPKQFISIDEGNCMLVQTIERMCEVVPTDKCFIITNRNLLDITWDTVKDLIPYSNIILEPEKKNTAACVAYASLLLKEKFGEGLLCFVPADGYVKDHMGYRNTIELAYVAAESTNNLVIIGITPTYPSTGYGYIQIDKDTDAEERVLAVLRFIEKPNFESAQELVSSGEFLWNGGILAGNMNTIVDCIKASLPDHFNKLSEAIKHEAEGNFKTYIENAYNELQNISFDKGVLEKSKSICVIRGNFDWDDIGSINTLSKTLNSDAEGNSIKGKHFGIGTSNSVIYGDDIFIATIGIDNLIVAATKEAIIVCPRDRAQDVKILVETLKRNGFENLL
ncbi:MAG TPA: mannose-1-phosphate guanylyltransferase [Ruminiclostridium sp.]